MLRVASAGVLLAVVVLAFSGCVPAATEPPAPPPGDQAAALAGIERDLIAQQIATAVSAGDDISADRSAIEDAVAAGLADANAEVSLATAVPEGGGQAVAPREGFQSAFAAWSLGLAMIGRTGQGQSVNGPSVRGDVTSTTTTQFTGQVIGPNALVDITITTDSSRPSGWTLRETSKFRTELPLCPDVEGVVEFHMDFGVTTDSSSGTGGTVAVADTARVNVQLTIDDDAKWSALSIGGSYVHDRQSSGPGLGAGVAEGSGSVSVTLGADGVSSSTDGDVTDQEEQESQAIGPLIVQTAAYVALAVASDKWNNGYCTKIIAEPASVVVDPGATETIELSVQHKFEGTELDDRITPTLVGEVSISPEERTESPFTITYVAPDEEGATATLKLESRSNRGVSRLDIPIRVKSPAYEINDTIADWHITGTICDIEQPFTLDRSSSADVATFSFTPDGRFTLTGNTTTGVADVTFDGSGTWTLVTDDDTRDEPYLSLVIEVYQVHSEIGDFDAPFDPLALRYITATPREACAT